MTKAERSWILYDCANSAQTLIITTAILPIYFKTVAAAEMSASDSTYYWALGNTVAAIVVAILAPILGALADRRGNKKRFFTVFLLAGILATAALAIVGEGEWRLCLLLYGFSTVGFYGAIVFYDSFLVDVTEKERMDWVSSNGFAWGYIVSTIPYVGCMALILNSERLGLGTIDATRACFIITAVWWFALSIPMLRNVHQRYYADDTPNPVRESLASLVSTLRDIPRYKHLFIFLIAYFLYIDGVHTIYKMSMAFGLDVGIKAEQLMLVLLVTQIVAFPCALIYGKLAGIFTAKRMILVGIATYFVVVVVAYFISSAWHFWLLAMLLATAQGGVQSLSRSIYGKLVPKQKAAQFFGFYDIFGKFAAILGPFMVGFFGSLAGNTRVGVFSLVVLFFLGGLLLIQVREDQAAVPD